MRKMAWNICKREKSTNELRPPAFVMLSKVILCSIFQRSYILRFQRINKLYQWRQDIEKRFFWAGNGTHSSEFSQIMLGDLIRPGKFKLQGFDCRAYNWADIRKEENYFRNVSRNMTSVMIWGCYPFYKEITTSFYTQMCWFNKVHQ